MRPLRTLLLYGHGGGGTLTYQEAWPRAFERHPRFAVTSVNALDRGSKAMLALGRRRFDVVVALHSLYSNAQVLPTRLATRIARRGEAVVYFVGNEYKLMPQKMAFAEALGVDLLVSQIANPEVHRLYAQRLHCRTLELPIIGLDTDVIRAGRPLAERPIELGYRGYDLTAYLGHEERRVVPAVFAGLAAERGVRADISLDPDDRLEGPAWIEFLQNCRAQLGVASGTDYFELTDVTRERVNRLISEGADFAALSEQVFNGYGDRVSGRALPGRVVEAAGTKTLSILVEGDYGDYFEPGVHYVEVRRDLSNAGDALDRLADDALCESLVAAAHQVALERLTYAKLLDRLHGAVLPLLGD